MPEGHTIHRAARDHERDLVGQPVKVSSPQGRFDIDALVDASGRARLRRVEAYGKHLFYVFDHSRIVHVHLGLFGKFYRRRSPAPPPRSTTPGPAACRCRSQAVLRLRRAREDADRRRPARPAPDLRRGQRLPSRGAAPARHPSRDAELGDSAGRHAGDVAPRRATSPTRRRGEAHRHDASLAREGSSARTARREHARLRTKDVPHVQGRRLHLPAPSTRRALLPGVPTPCRGSFHHIVRAGQAKPEKRLK